VIIMEQDKIGQFIKNIRIKNNLTQQAFAKKLGVTYQAVSKWENSKSIPDIEMLKLISVNFNVNFDDLINGEKKNNSRQYKFFLIIATVLIIFLFLTFALVCFYPKNDRDFEFKTISTTCKDFTINGSAAYNHDKTSIYISNVIYCGKENNSVYKKIECSLYEKYDNINKLVSKCDHEEENVTLENFLEDVQINVDNYSATCKKFKDSYLYLEIKATDVDGLNTTYQIPLTLKENC